uniref:NADPH:adrenodoxin oxidoreductase, mitochondrial n=1 Tax=Stygiella incarcerata TaxID=1712417 RepID=A0A192ZIW3_9EUKA|nr:ferredoxin reductase Arh1 [Stygiella incarcerata]
MLAQFLAGQRPCARLLLRPLHSQCPAFRVGIIGSGPSGLYTADALLGTGNHIRQNLEIDIFDKLPVPYGLLRYGVAPDHPEVLSIIPSVFEKLFLSPSTSTSTSGSTSSSRCRFFGNVDIPKDLSIDELKRHYHAVVMAIGCQDPVLLPSLQDPVVLESNGITDQVMSVNDFNKWYNGFPDLHHPQSFIKFERLFKNPNVRRAVIIGNGNVALDAARVLMADPIAKFGSTSMPSSVIDTLCASHVEHVTIMGRRGPVQAAFTTKELRELIELPNVVACIHEKEKCFQGINLNDRILSRPQRRLLELLASLPDTKDAVSPEDNDTNGCDKDQNRKKKKIVEFRFLASPLAVQRLFPQSMMMLECEKNVLRKKGIQVECVPLVGDGRNASEQKGVREYLPVDVIMTSIGYRGIPIEGLSFSEKKGTLIHKNGHVGDNVFASGWIKRGPKGIVGSNKWDAEQTTQTIIGMADLLLERHSMVMGMSVNEEEDISILLRQKGIRFVDFKGWQQIEDVEKKRGKERKKLVEKVTSVQEMLEIVQRERENVQIR